MHPFTKKDEQLGVRASSKHLLITLIMEAIGTRGGVHSVFSPRRTVALDVNYLTQIGCLESVPSTLYIAINLLRNFDETGLTLDDCVLTPVNLVFDTVEYELITMFPWDAAHVTCISKTRLGTWEGYDNERRCGWYIGTNCCNQRRFKHCQTKYFCSL